MSTWAITAKTCRTCAGKFLPSHWSQARCGECLSSCSVDGCVRPVKSNGLCGAHASRLRLSGAVGTEEIGSPRYVGVRAPRRPSQTQICRQCQKSFTRNYSLIKHAGDGANLFCSKSCYNAFRSIAPTITCAYCKKVALVSKNRSGRNGMRFNKNQKYCSLKCAHESSRIGWKVDKNGYRYKTVGGKQQFEHRIVMAETLGRSLLQTETVHHKDGNRSNNDPSNLELWSSRHGKGQRVSDKIAFCKSFLTEHGISVPVLDVSAYLSGQLAA